MRYYKQLHGLPHAYLAAVIMGVACLCPILLLDNAGSRLGFFVCAVFSFIAARVLWKSRTHYLDIGREWIVYRGIESWRLKRSDVLRVELCRKGLAEEYVPFLKIHAPGRAYEVEPGFLLNENRVRELMRALQQP